jgi:hypothetical protein
MQAAPKNGWSVLKHYEKECGRSLFGCGAVQHVGADSVRLGHSLRVWLGMVTAMAIVIEYYVPDKLRKRSEKWILPQQRGKIIPFPAQEKKSA